MASLKAIAQEMRRLSYDLFMAMPSPSSFSVLRKPVDAAAFLFSRKSKRTRSLPLPLPSPWPPAEMEHLGMMKEIVRVLDEVSDLLMSNLHNVHKNLQFWEARAQGTSGPKVRFMMLERGPYAFIQGAVSILYAFIHGSSFLQSHMDNTVSGISEQVVRLSDLQYHLATLLCEFQKEVEIFAEKCVQGQFKVAASSMLVSLNQCIMDLQSLHGFIYNGCNTEITDVDSYGVNLRFNLLPVEIVQKTEWTNDDYALCLELTLENFKRVDRYVSLLMVKLRRPRRASRMWIQYTGSAAGLALVSGWLVRHSPIMGSNDLENWLKTGAEAVIAFSKEHVEQPLSAIRDDLFETFRKRHKGSTELEDVHLAAESLHRMLVAFVEQTSGRKPSENASDQELMEIMINRYEHELAHPLQSLVMGDLLRSILIQVQKLKLDGETAMLELNQILRANEINFAILAALPAFFLTLFLGWALKSLFLKGRGTDGRGRAAGLHRRMLMAELEKTLLACETAHAKGEDGDASYQFGMSIYTLDRLYKVVEWRAVASGEWTSLRSDLIDLSRSNLNQSHKLKVTSRMTRFYECLLSSS